MASKKNAAPAVVDDIPFTTAGLSPEPGGDDGMTEEIVAAAPAGALSTEVDWNYGTDHSAHAVSLKADEVVIPMLKIVQGLSKIFKNRGKNGLPDCQEGDIYNSLTNQVYPNGIYVVPFGCYPCVIERKPAPNGEFIAKLAVDDPRVQKALKANGKDGWKKLHSPEKTAFHYTEEVPVGLLNPDNLDEVLSVALVPMSGTNVFPRKLWWNSMASAPKAHLTPRYAFRTRLFTVVRKGDGVESYKFATEPLEGKDWGTTRFRPGSPALDRCLDFLKLYESGALGKTDYSDVDSTDSEDAAEKKALADQPDF